MNNTLYCCIGFTIVNANIKTVYLKNLFIIIIATVGQTQRRKHKIVLKVKLKYSLMI